MYQKNLDLQDLDVRPVHQPKANWHRQFKKALTPFNQVALAGAGASLLYYAFSDPYSFCVILGVLLTLVPLLIVEKNPKFQAFQKRWGVPLKSWHLVSLALAIGAVLQVNSPASAFFFTTIENAIVNTLTESGAEGSTAFVNILFTIIRIGLLLAVVFGIFYGINQASQGGELRPIFSAFAVGIVSVVGIEGLSKWILGDSEGATPGGSNSFLPSPEVHAHLIEPLSPLWGLSEPFSHLLGFLGSFSHLLA